jgi:hypothetical protein
MVERIVLSRWTEESPTFFSAPFRRAETRESMREPQDYRRRGLSGVCKDSTNRAGTSRVRACGMRARIEA